MSELPVLQTIVTAYRFVFSQFATIIRLIWFPTVLGVVVSYFLAQPIQSAQAIGAIDFPRLLLNGFIQAALWSMVAVAIHRLILFNDRRPGTFIFFSFGKVELLFGLGLLIPIALVVIAAAAIIFVGFVAGVAGVNPTPHSQLSIWFIFFFLFALFAMIYVFIRLSLIYPIIVAEGTFGLRESWQLTHEHIWRLVGVNVLGLIPLIVVCLIALWITSPMLDRSSATAFAESRQRLLPFDIAFSSIVSIFAVALGVAFLSYSYKALRGINDDTILPAPAN